ncbi:hypothetical protein C8R43DRAFT_1238828 [Mycena crocata]|nr:hypothetical protein C8R43DRAFT_1238828 [Mycena crocata]
MSPSSSSSSSDPPRCLPEYLPQYGFGAETRFKQLVEKNAFLFRVHTPKSQALRIPDTAFAALKFDARYTADASSPAPHRHARYPTPTYADVAQHLDWTTRHSSPYITTSFSFMWAVWEAVRRYQIGVKHDVEIAVIDATAVAERCATVVEVLRSVPPEACAQQEPLEVVFLRTRGPSVLVYGVIPDSAVLASVPLLHIVASLPSYCLRPPSLIPPDNPLDRLAWSNLSSTQKRSYRKFCEARALDFLRSPPEARFRDSTSAAVRLAFAFLSTWFHWMLHLAPPRENEPTLFRNAAVTKVTELARAIAVWPAARDTANMWVVLREIALLIAEEAEIHARSKPDVAEAEEEIPALPGISTYPDMDAKDDRDAKSSHVTLPVILDPRNYLPTPPPTPPPLLIPRFTPSSQGPGRSRGSSVSALSPRDMKVESVIVSEEQQQHPATPNDVESPSLPFAVPARAEPASPGSAAAEKEFELVVASPGAAHFSETEHGVKHSMGDTASCLLTGFFFGALIVIVLSQRRPTLMYLS